MSLSLDTVHRAFLRLQNADAFFSLRKASLQSVTRWAFATHDMLELAPFERRRRELPVGKWLPEESRRRSTAVKHGLDARDRIVFVQEKREPEPEAHETLVWWEGLDAWLVRARVFVETGTYQHEVASVSRYLSRGGEAVREETVGRMGRSEAVFEYDGASLSTVSINAENRALSDDGNGAVTNEIHARYHHKYDSAGILTEIIGTRMEPGSDTAVAGTDVIVYRAVRPNASMRKLAEQIGELLVSVVPEAVRRLAPIDPCIGLLLVYDRENDVLPPELAVQTIRDVETLRTRYGSKLLPGYLWNPAELQWFSRPELALNIPELSRLSAEFRSSGSHPNQLREGRRVLNQVASRLLEVDWPSIVTVVDELSIVAVDLESQHDLDKNATASLGRKWVSRLKRKGWL